MHRDYFLISNVLTLEKSLQRNGKSSFFKEMAIPQCLLLKHAGLLFELL